MNFSAVILAGGQSTRMGRDKAWLPLGGRPLLARQIEIARELAPTEVLISGRAEADYSGFGCAVIRDAFPGAGPLAGIAAALAAAAAPLVLVLAVDMPHLTTGVLRVLLRASACGVGVVPRVNRQVEPLAAVYPKTAQSVARDLLGQGLRTMRTFVDGCQQSGLLTVQDMGADEVNCFTNWNSPADLLPCLTSGPKPGDIKTLHRIPVSLVNV